VKAAEAANKEGGTGHGGKIFPLVLDVSDRSAADSELWSISWQSAFWDADRCQLKRCGHPSVSSELFDHLPPDFKNIDILVNNAGLVYGREHVGDM
jgi:3-hydroxy acid dehydrogenase/malonic semialdehyde reductase